MASVNQIIEFWDGNASLDEQRIIAAFKEMREVLRYVADQEVGTYRSLIDLIDDSVKILAKLEAEE